ncbi:DJ-1/PfpI family protein [Brevibacillus daliensis]|uniref:DJ-1/PfpI family protein n=1 Tax=Brevibacillus daliensis TaxID=2892995 RepID=UPI001E3E4463|nr:DJ-1/PfpI family protein [Brevibacillus daliensis]
MKSLIYLAPGFVDFEISILTYCLSHCNSDIITIASATDKEGVTSVGGLRVMPHAVVGDVQAEEYDLLVIPGGNYVFDVKEDEEILGLIRNMHQQNKKLAAICGGPLLLEKAGILTDKRYTTSVDDIKLQEAFTDQDVTVDGNIITAKGGAYVEFAVEVTKQLNLFIDEADELETIQYFKNLTK